MKEDNIFIGEEVKFTIDKKDNGETYDLISILIDACISKKRLFECDDYYYMITRIKINENNKIEIIINKIYKKRQS